MAIKYMCLLVLAGLVSQASALAEYRLDDVDRKFESNPFFGDSIGISKWMFDTLESCHVTLPDGRLVEAFPDTKLDVPTLSFTYSAHPFTSCGIGFRNSPESLSGTYELISVVKHISDGSLSLTRQRFHVTIVTMDLDDVFSPY